jgi:DNA modification methylase
MAHGKPRDPRKEQYWRRLIQHWKNSGPMVDPCGGGFTTAVACVRLGDRRFISCDVEAECVRRGLARIEQERQAGARTYE